MLKNVFRWFSILTKQRRNYEIIVRNNIKAQFKLMLGIIGQSIICAYLILLADKSLLYSLQSLNETQTHYYCLAWSAHYIDSEMHMINDSFFEIKVAQQSCKVILVPLRNSVSQLKYRI